MAQSIQAIIFDFGGVLINWDPHELYNKYFSHDRQAIDNFLAEIDFVHWNLSQDGGYPFSDAVKNLSLQFPQYAHLIRAYDLEWEESIKGIIPGTVEIVKKLKIAGYHLYGLTNWSAEKFSLVRHKYEVFDLFEEIVVSGEVGMVKPDPAIFHFLSQKIHFLSENCLLIDDSLANIKVAQRLGFTTHHFSSPATLELSLIESGVLSHNSESARGER